MTTTDLIKSEWVTAPVPSLFEPATVTAMIAWVTEQALESTATIETVTGRKQIASNAHNVSKCKVFLDSRGKDLVQDWKARAKLVDEQRKRIRDELDDLKAQVRKPLDDWAQAEQDRVDALETRIEEIVLQSIVAQDATSQEIAKLLAATSAIVVDASFAEMIERATTAKARAVEDLKTRLAARIKFENDQEELQALRKAADQRAIKDREEQIRQESAAKAKLEAEAFAKAKADADKLASDAKAMEAKLAIERANAERAAAEAREQRAKEIHEAELARIIAEAEARDKAKVAEAEAKRIAEEETVQIRKRDSDLQAKIEAEAIHDLEHECGDLSYNQAEAVFAMVKAGTIRHMEVVYHADIEAVGDGYD